MLVVVIASNNSNGGNSGISVGILTLNSNSGQFLHSLSCSVVWGKSRRSDQLTLYLISPKTEDEPGV